MNAVNWWEPLILHAVIALLLCEVGFRLSLSQNRWIWNFLNVYSDTVHEKCALSTILLQPHLLDFPTRIRVNKRMSGFFFYSLKCAVFFSTTTLDRPILSFVFFFTIFFSSYILLNIYNLLFVWFCFALCFLLQARTHTHSLAMPFYREANNTESEKKGTRESKPAEKHTRLGEIYVWMQTQIKIFVSCRKSKWLLHGRKM